MANAAKGQLEAQSICFCPDTCSEPEEGLDKQYSYHSNLYPQFCEVGQAFSKSIDVQ